VEHIRDKKKNSILKKVGRGSSDNLFSESTCSGYSKSVTIPQHNVTDK
jgi:hypothetical protein